MTALVNKIVEQKLIVIGFLVTALLTYTAYYDIFNHQFLQWDDKLYIHKNKHIHALSLNNLIWMFTSYDQGNWHPVTWLSMALNISIWGFNPVAFKLVNIAIHLLNSVLVYILSTMVLSIAHTKLQSNGLSVFSRLNRQHFSVSSLVAAMIFALHPQHVESVSWIAERKDVLCGFFFLATLISYLKFRETNRSSWISLSLVLYFFALMSKPMAVTIPLVLILIDIYPLKLANFSNTIRQNIYILFRNKISFIVLSAAASLITVLTQINGIQGLDTLSIGSRIINACMSIYLYIYKFVFPVNLSPFYPFHPWSTEPGIYSIIPVAGLVIIISSCFYAAWKYKIYFPLFSLAYFIVTLIPVIGLIKVGSQAAADRYTYLPMVVFYIVLAGGLSVLMYLSREYLLRRTLLVVGTGFYIAFLGFTTYKQNFIWRNDELLWNEAIRQYPGQADRAYSNLANFYFNTGQFDKARLTFSKAIALLPRNIEILEKMGKTNSLLHNDRIALHYYRKLIQLYPDQPRGYTLVGDHYYTQKNINQAKYFYTKAFEIAPNTKATLQRKALVDYLNKDIVSAKRNIDYLLQLAPNDIGGLQLAAKIYLVNGEFDKSLFFAEKIQRIEPGDSFSLNILNIIKSNNKQNNDREQ